MYFIVDVQTNIKNISLNFSVSALRYLGRKVIDYSMTKCVPYSLFRATSLIYAIIN